jgi:hypothetical protein
MNIDRRRLLLTCALGLGAYAIPGFARDLPPQPGFTHSGGLGRAGPRFDAALDSLFVPSRTSRRA